VTESKSAEYRRLAAEAESIAMHADTDEMRRAAQRLAIEWRRLAALAKVQED